MFQPGLHTETLRSSSFLNFSIGYSYFTSAFTQFPVRLVYVMHCVYNCIYNTGNTLSFKMHKDIYLYISFSIKTAENKNNTELSFPISMPSFIRLLIRHKMLHFTRAEGLNAWRTGLLCEWERASAEAMCDISVRGSLLPSV